MNQEIQEKKRKLEEKQLCLHCLGRQFAQLGHGLENYERGAIIENTEELSEDDFKKDNIPENLERGGSCEYCQDVFKQIEKYTQMVLNSFERYELETFLIGIRPPEKAIENEEKLWEEAGIQYTEPIKTELSRLIGKEIEEKTDLNVDFERADIMAVIDMREGKNRVELQVNSLLIYSQYNKYSREIPQTEWHCRKCRGRGCEKCDWTGKQYPTSVQEEIQQPFIEATNAVDVKFHGNGREDVDAKCMGRREFVLELREPLKRDIDLEELQETVNNQSDKVEIFETEFTHKDKIEEVKNTRTDKEYLAKVKTEKIIEKNQLEQLKQLETTIEQRTPERVSQRRADKIREREVYKIETEKTGDKTFNLTVKAEAGTYIKELIHGDNERTKPSVTQILETPCECEQLDITWVEKVGNQ